MAYSTHDYSKDNARTMSKTVSDTAQDMADKATQQIGKAVDTAESTMRSLADRSSQAGEQMQEVAGNLRGAIDKSVKDQPMATLAIAAVLGFTLGALWKS
jgi:ElaB/YqjD/DUF883 family membrane-anchored ribosome-binding protein